MEPLILPIFLLICGLNRHLAIENLALRQQLAILRRQTNRPRIRIQDRLFWVIVSRLWYDWRNVLTVVKPETVIRWHRMGFSLFWKLKSRGRPGRPAASAGTRRLIIEMAESNPTWGAPRIHGGLKSLGIRVHEKTVSNVTRRFRAGRPPSQTWRAFLKNHMHNTCAIDFLTVPTACDLQNPVCACHSSPWVQEGGALQRSGRAVEHRSENGKVVTLPRLGGLNHRYEWREAA